MYIRYIYKLHDLHRACKNYTEAGFTLLLHADTLQWDHHELHADFGFPAQYEWQRKEQLYKTIIDYFNTGKVSHELCPVEMFSILMLFWTP